MGLCKFPFEFYCYFDIDKIYKSFTLYYYFLMNDVLKTKKCITCNNIFDITTQDSDFYNKVSPILSGQKYLISDPKNCPDCRQQRRYARRNERSLYHRKCDFSGKQIISMYRPDSKFPVYQNKYRWSDDNDPIKYGQELDFTKNIFSQVQQLQQKVPRLHRFTYSEERMLNSEYTNCTWDLKDCYLSFATARSENTYYSDYLVDCNNCIDILVWYNSQNCYECADIEGCYELFYSQDCFNCKHSFYLNDCVDCSDCIGCVWLRNKKYHILNKAYDKESFTEVKATLMNDHWAISVDFIKKYDELYFSVPKKYIHWNHNENSTWDYVNNSKNIEACFDVNNSENIKYCAHFLDGKNCMDFSSWWESELCYEVSWWWDDMYKCSLSVSVFGCKNTYYSDLCFYCNDCFACVWLHHKQYCILNKQYTKQEYEEIVPKIIEHMQSTGERWELFPIEISTFAYNESLAQEHFPLTLKEAEDKSYPWIKEDYPVNIPQWIKLLEKWDLSNLSDQEIVDSAILCDSTNKPFRIISSELKFYRKYNMPLPTKHPSIRYKSRLQKRMPRKLFDRKCDKCELELKTTYSLDRKEIIYCETCYSKEIYW